MPRSPVVVLLVASLVLAAAVGVAQESPTTTDRAGDLPTMQHTAQLQITTVIGRYQRERRVASTPYSFLAPVNDAALPEGKRTIVRLKMGVEVPIAVSQSEGITSFQYRNVATNIECNARDEGGGVFGLALVVESSSVYAAADAGEEASYEATAAAGKPIFRSFYAELSPLLRDGQSVETVASRRIPRDRARRALPRPPRSTRPALTSHLRATRRIPREVPCVQVSRRAWSNR